VFSSTATGTGQLEWRSYADILSGTRHGAAIPQLGARQAATLITTRNDHDGGPGLKLMPRRSVTAPSLEATQDGSSRRYVALHTRTLPLLPRESRVKQHSSVTSSASVETGVKGLYLAAFGRYICVRVSPQPSFC
jgi:hypothetical protein